MRAQPCISSWPLTFGKARSPFADELTLELDKETQGLTGLLGTNPRM
jgi:hypothetical protein